MNLFSFNKIPKAILISLFLLFAFAVPGLAATYRVDPSGSGTSPYDTWAKASTTIQNVFDTIDIDGPSTIEIHGDSGSSTTYREQVTWGSDDFGTSGNEVILKGSGDSGHDGTVIISAANLMSGWTEDGTTDYTSDANMVAYYMFETSPGINKSGTGDNHVDDVSKDPDPDTSNYKEGSQSADFEVNNSDVLSCENANLTSDFPGKTASDSFTIVAWIRPEETVSHLGIGCMEACYKFFDVSTDKLYGCLYYSDSGGGAVEDTANSTLTIGTWYHVALVLNGTSNKMYLYVNGSIDNDTGADFDHILSTSVTKEFCVGGLTDAPSYGMDGNIDELAVFDRALNSTEINEIKDSGLAGSGVEDVWKATCTTQPYVVAFNGTVGTPETSKENLDAANEWYWESNVLYVYSSGGNPGTVYTDPGIEAGARADALINGQDYTTIDNITFAHANGEWSENIYIYGTYATIQNCVIKQASHYGSLFSGNNHTVINCDFYENSAGTEAAGWSYAGIQLAFSSINTVTISNCEVYDAFDEGSGIGGTGSNITIAECDIHDNPKEAPSPITAYHNIYISTPANNVTIEKCKIYDSADGSGIKVDANNASIRYNEIYGNRHAGIILEAQDEVGTIDIYGNVIFENNRGILLNDYLWKDGMTVNIYNNTIAENDDDRKSTPIQVEIELDIDPGGVNIKNNIIYSSNTGSGYYLINSNTTQTNMDSDYNSFYGGDSSNPFYYAGNKTFTTWKSSTGGDGNSFDTNPQLKNPGSDDFTLQSTSPCIDTGTNSPGSSFDDGLDPDSSWVSDVTTLDQDLHGNDWEIGAYVYQTIWRWGHTVDE